jgi:uncharacterized repeat protein (TIGR01451 family)
MKRAVLALLVAVAASPAPMAHAEAGGPVSTSDYAPVGQPLFDFSDRERGMARLSLRVERGLFTVSGDGHLRTFKRKYLYTLTNAASLDGFWLDRLAPSTCGSAYLALPPTLVSGPPGDPDAWQPTTWRGIGDRDLEWACDRPSAEGIAPGATYRFALYTDADPTAAPVDLGGLWISDDFFDSFFPEPLTAHFTYVVPGCFGEAHAVVSEFDLELSATPAQAAPGQALRCTLRATNVGLDRATHVTLWDALPAPLSYVAGSLTRNGAPIADGGVNPLAAGLNLGTLTTGDPTQEISFLARVAPGTPDGASILHVARLSSDQTEPFDSNAVTTRVRVGHGVGPLVAIQSPTAGIYGQDSTPTVQFSVTGVSAGIDPNDIVALLDTQVVANGAKLDLFRLAPGKHTFSVWAVDREGNSGSASVAFDVAPTIGSTILQVMHARSAGLIRLDQTMALLNSALNFAQARLRAGDVKTALMSLEGFRKALNSSARRTTVPGGEPLIQEEAVALLNASAEYLLQHPMP